MADLRNNTGPIFGNFLFCKTKQNRTEETASEGDEILGRAKGNINLRPLLADGKRRGDSQWRRDDDERRELLKSDAKFRGCWAQNIAAKFF